MLALGSQHAAALKSFKYKGADLSLLYHYLLSPLAQWCVDALTPVWAAPNALTLLGLVPPVATLAVAYALQPELGQGMPGWVALLCALSMFFYSTLDNMDGKQARKTGSSSALGLLFDHGCDAINAGLVNWANIALISGASAGSWQCFFWFLIPVVPFFFATWEERHLGALALCCTPNLSRVPACALSPSPPSPSLSLSLSRSRSRSLTRARKTHAMQLFFSSSFF